MYPSIKHMNYNPYGNALYDTRNFNGQLYNPMKAMNFTNKMNDQEYPINNFNYTLGNSGNNIHTYDMSKRRRSSYMLSKSYANNDNSKSNYAVYKKHRSPSYQSISTNHSELESKVSFNYNEENEYSEKSMRMNNTRRDNTFQVTCNIDGKNDNGKYGKKKIKNSIYNMSNSDYDSNENVSIYSKPKHKAGVDNEDMLVNDGGTTWINININGNINRNRNDYDSEEEEEEEEDEYADDDETYDDQYTNMHNQMQKPSKPRKVFMGSYYLSDLKKKLLTPLHICAPHPTIFAPNPNVICYGITPKEKERNKKPKIVVRY